MSRRFATLGIGHLREDSNGDGTMDQRGPLLLVAPLLVAAALFLPSIGERIISLEDEARYALLARNMLETGDWLIPRLDGEVHMEKSPLFMWAIAALSLPGRAVTELTATLPSALSAIGGVGATLLLGRRMFGPRVGLLAAFCLATTFGYYWHARLALADMMMTCFIVAGALAFWTGIDGGQARRGPLALFWACLGLGLSAKRPAGLMPILPFTAFLVAERGWRGLRDLKPIMGAAILALVTAPWALAFALQGDESYVQSVLVGDYWAPRRAGCARHAAGPQHLRRDLGRAGPRIGHRHPAALPGEPPARDPDTAHVAAATPVAGAAPRLGGRGGRGGPGRTPARDVRGRLRGDDPGARVRDAGHRGRTQPRVRREGALAAARLPGRSSRFARDVQARVSHAGALHGSDDPGAPG